MPLNSFCIQNISGTILSNIPLYILFLVEFIFNKLYFGQNIDLYFTLKTVILIWECHLCNLFVSSYLINKKMYVTKTKVNTNNKNHLNFLWHILNNLWNWRWIKQYLDKVLIIKYHWCMKVVFCLHLIPQLS